VVPITADVSISRKRFPPAPRARPHRTLAWAAVALLAVVALGTVGIMVIEGWSFAQSLFFTLITLTTIGYGDYGLSDAGRLFTIVLMVVGLGVVTFSAGHILPSLFNYQLAWERMMNNRILKLEDHFIVCGLGRIGRAVCQRLAREGVPFIAIDPDPAEVAIVAEAGFIAMVGDATDDEVLEEAGIARARAIACVTGSDTENIVITLSARGLNADLLIVSRAEEDDAMRKMQRAGATRVISPIRSGGVSIAGAILKPNIADFLERAHDRTQDFELAEVTIGAGSTLDGSTIRQKGAAHPSIAVVALKRVQTSAQMRPKPDDTLRGGDVLIVAGDMMAIDGLQRDAASRPKAA
jgi:voltage-gated potassium channel